ncbi:site-2 protease family protein [Mycolicibacterium brumae]|uniref:Site-2 protease family protein n=1 Tax=Mycolicibacterium brumae TaxID=85968 RepID=A0A2G5PHB7_9MYCO|nr:site-2 protease family protein [Mycolicibacterium brumae]MCV7192600.1 site-2 protease family protein [Mycolicibacterium brumae]PIB77413.1 site-2 protease family protein [Mycolicibacterium brumae]RWA18408.1 hypothetical protein MBRU_04120 [Mycolicibacterium brumae DSM 44177]UWW10370.1 site-2 protease family protein [Mycolicibacterium brumae]
MTVHPIRSSVRPSPIFLLIVGVAALGGVLAWMAGDEVKPLAYAGVFILVIAGWVVSLCLHEFGHAFTAYRFGDREAAIRGYLTLNPLKYANPGLSLALPLLFIAIGGIGLPGGAVWVNTSGMTKTQQSVVSLAGPIANLALAVGLLTAVQVGYSPEHSVFWSGIAFLALLQVMALVLNLLPIPGLDGYGALEPHLSPQLRQQLDPVRQWGFLILLVVLLLPPLNGWFFGFVFKVYELFGGISALAGVGYGLTLFWR